MLSYVCHYSVFLITYTSIILPLRAVPSTSMAIIISLIGFHSSNSYSVFFVIIIASPCLCMVSSLSENITLYPVFNLTFLCPIHLHSLMPMTSILFVSISLASWTDFHIDYNVVTFNHPIYTLTFGLVIFTLTFG